MGIRLRMVNQRTVFRVGDFFLPGRLNFLHVEWPLTQTFEMPTMAQLFRFFFNHLHPTFQWVRANNLFEAWWADIILHPTIFLRIFHFKIFTFISTNFQMHAPPHHRVGGGRCFFCHSTFHWKGFCTVLLFKGIFFGEPPGIFFRNRQGGRSFRRFRVASAFRAHNCLNLLLNSRRPLPQPMADNWALAWLYVWNIHLAMDQFV